MVDYVIDLDDPRALPIETVLSQTLLCWEDVTFKDLDLKGHELVIRPKPEQTTRDACGNGKPTSYIFTKPQMAWKQFPVYYHVDPTNCNYKDKNAIRIAIQNCFEDYNQILGKPAFQPTTDRAAAKFKIYWAAHDGQLGQLAICNYKYYPTRGELIEATIKFDMSDNWFINPERMCGYKYGPFDIAHCAMHEIGHGLGLSHVSLDPECCMFPTMKRSDTMYRSIDLGTAAGIKLLYNVK